jgi:hemerythrin-like domain-containing protein
MTATTLDQVRADPIAIWHTEHVYFMRLLDLFDSQVAVFETGARPNYELMLDIISYLREYSDHYHHPREDIAFARLEGHRPQLADTLARLRQEHRVIANAGETLEHLLIAITEGSIVARAEVEAAAATYLVYYGKHIAREESDVLPHAARALTPADWQAVRDAIPAAADPLFGETPVQRYRELRRRMS